MVSEEDFLSQLDELDELIQEEEKSQFEQEMEHLQAADEDLYGPDINKQLLDTLMVWTEWVKASFPNTPVKQCLMQAYIKIKTCEDQDLPIPQDQVTILHNIVVQAVMLSAIGNLEHLPLAKLNLITGA